MLIAPITSSSRKVFDLVSSVSVPPPPKADDDLSSKRNSSNKHHHLPLQHNLAPNVNRHKYKQHTVHFSDTVGHTPNVSYDREYSGVKVSNFNSLKRSSSSNHGLQNLASLGHQQNMTYEYSLSNHQNHSRNVSAAQLQHYSNNTMIIHQQQQQMMEFVNQQQLQQQQLQIINQQMLMRNVTPWPPSPVTVEEEKYDNSEKKMEINISKVDDVVDGDEGFGEINFDKIENTLFVDFLDNDRSNRTDSATSEAYFQQQLLKHIQSRNVVKTKSVDSDDFQGEK